MRSVAASRRSSVNAVMRQRSAGIGRDSEAVPLEDRARLRAREIRQEGAGGRPRAARPHDRGRIDDPRPVGQRHAEDGRRRGARWPRRCGRRTRRPRRRCRPPRARRARPASARPSARSPSTARATRGSCFAYTPAGTASGSASATRRTAPPVSAARRRERPPRPAGMTMTSWLRQQIDAARRARSGRPSRRRPSAPRRRSGTRPRARRSTICRARPLDGPKLSAARVPVSRSNPRAMAVIASVKLAAAETSTSPAAGEPAAAARRSGASHATMAAARKTSARRERVCTDLYGSVYGPLRFRSNRSEITRGDAKARRARRTISSGGECRRHLDVARQRRLFRARHQRDAHGGLSLGHRPGGGCPREAARPGAGRLLIGGHQDAVDGARGGGSAGRQLFHPEAVDLQRNDPDHPHRRRAPPYRGVRDRPPPRVGRSRNTAPRAAGPPARRSSSRSADATSCAGLSRRSGSAACSPRCGCGLAISG